MPQSKVVQYRSWDTDAGVVQEEILAKRSDEHGEFEIIRRRIGTLGYWQYDLGRTAPQHSHFGMNCEICAPRLGTVREYHEKHRTELEQIFTEGFESVAEEAAAVEEHLSSHLDRRELLALGLTIQQVLEAEDAHSNPKIQEFYRRWNGRLGITLFPVTQSASTSVL